MAQQIVSIPSQVIDELMRQVFYRAASLSLAKGEGVIGRLIVPVAIRAAVVVPFIMLVVLLANVVFACLLGSSCADAAFYARLMAAGWVVGLITIPFFSLPILLDCQRFQSVAEVVNQSTRVVMMLIAYLFASSPPCFGLFAAQDVLCSIGFAIALFQPRATRTLAVGQASPNADSVVIASWVVT
jgi:hypothetical protein